MRFRVQMAQTVLVAILILPSFTLGQDDTDDICSQEEWDEYFSAIHSHVKGFWNPPAESKAVSCTVLLRQDFRSEIEHVEILACGDDEAVHQSVEYAGYEASPLPVPKDRACFTRQLTIRLEHTPQ